MKSRRFNKISRNNIFSMALGAAVLIWLLMSCRSPEQPFDARIAKARLDEIAAKAYRMYSAVKDTTHLPRTLAADGRLHLVPSEDWTSGFFPGYLWYVYEYTNDEKFLHAALRETSLLEKEQLNTTTHDVGFMMYCSYGHALRLTGNEAYKTVLLQAAKSLTTRFHPTVGCIKSWDGRRWDFPVIIDNMMNLELFF